MCWNKDVSLNTFLFSIFTLFLIIYNNTFTKYKINEINNIFAYIFLLSFILMQLIEYFLWQNLNDKFYNKLLSFFAASLIFIQPIASTLIIKNLSERNFILFLYLLFGIPFALIKILNTKFSTSIANNGHLKWDWIDSGNKYIYIFYLFYFFFLFYPLIREKLYFSFLIAFILLLISIYSYYRDGTADSMWCWSVNTIMLYFLIKLLIILPFYK
jgi:hypothetical protein